MKLDNPIIIYIKRNNMIDDFISYSVYMRYYAGLSYFNSAALVAQRRGVGFAASESTWQRRFRREIKPGANPLVIIKPFAPLDLYFEANDTYSPKGDPLPEWIAEDSSHIPNFNYKPFMISIESIYRMLNNHGVYYDEREMGSQTGGIMEYCETPVWVNAYHNKAYERIQTHYAMVVNSKRTPEDKAAAVFHEIGHLLCGHLSQDETLKKYSWIELSVPKRDQTRLSTEQKEYEAETACMLIMNGLGYEYDRSKYLNGYLVNGVEPQYNLEMSIAAADQFLRWMKDDQELRYYIPNLV